MTTTDADNSFEDDGFVDSTAQTVPEALADLWAQAARFAEKPGEPVAITYPLCAPLAQPRVWAAFFAHLDCCKDACDAFGTRVVAAPSADGDARALVLQAVAKSARGVADENLLFSPNGVEDDDDDDWDLSPELAAKLREAEALDDEEAAPTTSSIEGSSSSSFALVEAPDAEVLDVTKRWVDAVVSGAGVCPFSVNADKAGLPVGRVRYHVSRAADAEAAYAAYWREVATLQAATETELSTTLLVLADARWTTNLEEFETLGGTLAQALASTDNDDQSDASPTTTLGMDRDIQLVFFHPRYAFRDGRDRAGADEAANFARRSPYPMINILRTSQVRTAQRGLPTALVYAQNEQTLAELGAGFLADMLDKRDWSGMDGKRVDRKQVEVLRLAQDLMRQASDAPSSPGTTTTTPES